MKEIDEKELEKAAGGWTAPYDPEKMKGYTPHDVGGDNNGQFCPKNGGAASCLSCDHGYLSIREFKVYCELGL